MFRYSLSLFELMHSVSAEFPLFQMLGNPERLLDLCAPAAEAGLVKMAIADVGLIKLWVSLFKLINNNF